jgi:23S rRNA pseudouridine955/2504/2580 synthase
MKNIPVLFENDFCIVLNKPPGLPVQGGKGVKISLDLILAERWNPPPLLVHRLDKDTSGIILAAKNRESAALFAALFAGGEKGPSGGGLIKRYIAVCRGCPQPESGFISLILDIRGKAKSSFTSYRRLAGNKDFSFLELELGTGRTHQIRRHLAQIGNPLLGDDKYGDFGLNKTLAKTMGLKRLLLHSARLVVSKESAGFSLDIEAPPPDHFRAFLERAGI